MLLKCHIQHFLMTTVQISKTGLDSREVLNYMYKLCITKPEPNACFIVSMSACAFLTAKVILEFTNFSPCLSLFSSSLDKPLFVELFER